MTTHPPDALVATLESSSHPEWGDHSTNPVQRVDLPFVLETWAICAAATLALGGVITAIVAAFYDQPIATTEGVQVAFGIATVVFAFTTFGTFAAVLSSWLGRERGDRLVNSLAVGIAHTGSAMLIAAVYGIIVWATNPGAQGLVDAAWADQVGMIVTLMVVAAPASLVASLLAVGTVPARGPRPSGTQHVELDPDAQL